MTGMWSPLSPWLGWPRREVLPRVELLNFSQLPTRSASNMAGLLLTATRRVSHA